MKTTDKIKRQPTKWEKIFAIDRTEKGYPNTETAHTIQLEKKKKDRQKTWIASFLKKTYGWQQANEKLFNVTTH